MTTGRQGRRGHRGPVGAEHVSAAARRHVPKHRDRVAVWACDDRGDGGGTALVWVMLVPAILLVVFFGIQVAETGYARSLGQSAAEAGVRAAVSFPGDAARAAPAAQAFLADHAKNYLTDAAVSVTVTDVSVSVTVTGSSPSLIPGGSATVTQTASGPLERLGEGAIP